MASQENDVHCERSLINDSCDLLFLFASAQSLFSNSHTCPFEAYGRTYLTAMQFYQSEKASYFGDHQKAERVYQEKRPSACKRLASEVKNFDSSVWQKVAPQVMLVAVTHKFNQNSDAREKLLATGDAIIVSAGKFDNFWGTGLDITDDNHKVRTMWLGCNMLGKILMQVRQRLRYEQM